MSKVLSSLSDDMAAAVAAASPSVVRVAARDRLPASGIVWSTDGVIVTAHHVVERDDNIHVGLPDGRTVPATLVGRDSTTDLAVLQAEATGLTPPIWTGPDSLRVGHLMLALGRPVQAVWATMGIVSVLGQGWTTSAGGHLDHYLNTDAVNYPGFSGGPLVDGSGRVVGLNTSAWLQGRGMILTVPAPTTVPFPTVHRVVEMLLAHGRIRWDEGSLPTRVPEPLAKQLGAEIGEVVQRVRRSLVQIHSAGSGRHGIGAGTIWHPDGLIITNAHVVASNSLRVTLPSGSTLPARLLARDSGQDVAALVVDARGLSVIELGDSKGVQPGQWVLALGHPWGVTDAATAGVVIGVGRDFPEIPQSDREWIAVGLTLRPGHSGGPLVDVQGRLVGINTIMTGPEVGMAVPVHVAKSFLRQRLGSPARRP
jgi:S1-C subfamily serine protease